MKETLKFVSLILLNLAIIYLAIIGFLYFFADHLVFHPFPASYQDSKQIIKLKTVDGVLISAIYLENPQAKFTILYSHGNATDIGEMLPFFRALQNHGFAVFAYDYHGYGTSTGKPTEKNVYYDITAAYDYLTQTLQIPPKDIIAYGQSIGAAVSLELATQKPLGGVVLESPFITAFRTVTHFSLLPFDKYNNLRKIAKVKVPILFIHGTADHVIGIWHSKKLFSMAQSPKFSLWIPNAGHNDLLIIAGENYWQALQKIVSYVQTPDEE